MKSKTSYSIFGICFSTYNEHIFFHEDEYVDLRKQCGANHVNNKLTWQGTIASLYCYGLFVYKAPLQTKLFLFTLLKLLVSVEALSNQYHS